MLCDEFNKLTTTLKREEQQSTNSYPWLAEDDERRYFKRQILEKYIDLETVYNPERRLNIYAIQLQRNIQLDKLDGHMPQYTGRKRCG